MELGKKQEPAKNCPQKEAVWCRRVYKPGSVLTAIYLAPQLLTGSSRLLGTVGRTYCPSTALLRDRVYIIKPMFPWAGCALTAPFHPYHRRLPHINAHFPASGKARPICAISSFPSNPLALGFDGSPVQGRRYLSVALVLRFPSAGVTRYPCPVEPGLSSSGPFRFPSAAVQPSLRGYFTARNANCQIEIPLQIGFERIILVMK